MFSIYEKERRDMSIYDKCNDCKLPNPTEQDCSKCEKGWQRIFPLLNKGEELIEEGKSEEEE